MVLASGDRITGEVKKLERGKLKYKTDEIGVGKGSKTTNGTLSRSEAQVLEAEASRVGPGPAVAQLRVGAGSARSRWWRSGGQLGRVLGAQGGRSSTEVILAFEYSTFTYDYPKTEV